MSPGCRDEKVLEDPPPHPHRAHHRALLRAGTLRLMHEHESERHHQRTPSTNSNSEQQLPASTARTKAPIKTARRGASRLARPRLRGDGQLDAASPNGSSRRGDEANAARNLIGQRTMLSFHGTGTLERSGRVPLRRGDRRKTPCSSVVDLSTFDSSRFERSSMPGAIIGLAPCLNSWHASFARSAFTSAFQHGEESNAHAHYGEMRRAVPGTRRGSMTFPPECGHPRWPQWPGCLHASTSPSFLQSRAES
jgi:hypothetical protein